MITSALEPFPSGFQTENRNRGHSLFCFAGFHFGSIRIPNRKQKQRFVPVTFQIGDRLWPIVTDCDRLWPIVTKPVLLKKLKKKRSDRFQTRWPILTDCDRHKCHIRSSRLKWLVQIPFLFLFESGSDRLLVFCGIDRFLGLFWMNPQETHSKVHRRKDTQFAFLAFCKLIRPVRHEIWTKLVGWKHEAITEIMFLGNNLQTVLGHNLQNSLECSFLGNRIHDHIFF